MEPILQSLGQGNPQLAQAIAAHQDEFLQLLSEEGGDMGEGMEGLEGIMPNAAGQTTIAVTEEERDAIERLCNLGFSRDAVIQAYFACDKNEELAANFLFDQPDDDEP
ncbi:geranylgeranyl pyrophosphate synthetase [Ascosphaera pollenicola]|nr:geranylgeranyl pyrophosphate synthetase [Ascosphaera pollenicola]